MSQRFNMRVGANAVIVRDDAILLVEYGNGWKRHFNLPGGGIEPGESIVDGLRREIREETAEITAVVVIQALHHVSVHGEQEGFWGGKAAQTPASESSNIFASYGQRSAKEGELYERPEQNSRAS